MTLKVDLELLRQKLSLDAVGYADLSLAKDYIAENGVPFLTSFPRAISIGAHMGNTMIESLIESPEENVQKNYTRFLYDQLNDKLDRAAFEVAMYLEKQGYRAYPIPTAQTLQVDKFKGIISNKLAASLAGLGWIGKSCLLIHPEFGPRMRYTTVFTDAPFEAGSPMERKCGDCDNCVKACPVQAFTGVPFDPSEPREARFYPDRCRSYIKGLREAGNIDGGGSLCMVCVAVCPFGS